MSFKRYLKNMLPIILMNLFCILILSLFLIYIGNSIDTIVIIIISWLFILISYISISFYKRKIYLDKLLSMIEQLDEKYLIAELMKNPERADDRVFYKILKTTEKSMLENINSILQERKEYKNYIEQWIHEVKTPITALKLLCENNLSDFSRSILSELEKIERFTEQALYYARIEQTEKDFYIKEVRLSSVVHKAIIDNKYLLRQNNISVNADNVVDIAYTDEKWIRFILNQLIGNSVKYHSSNPFIHFCTKLQDDYVQLIVSDNGIGISESDLPCVFKKGFTGENGRIIQSSTGIGLYLCKQLCDKLGINLEIKSNETGTTAILKFQINHFIVQR